MGCKILRAGEVVGRVGIGKVGGMISSAYESR
jgi:hypothetical protein